MINTTKLLKVTVIWVTLVYLVCFLGILAFPALRGWFILYGLHMQISSATTVTTVGTFVSGLVIWNAVALLATYTWSLVWNKIA